MYYYSLDISYFTRQQNIIHIVRVLIVRKFREKKMEIFSPFGFYFIAFEYDTLKNSIPS